MAEETILVKIDLQGDEDALTNQEKLRQSMVRLAEEKRQINKAYGAGNITQKEYAQELTRVDNVLKKVTADHTAEQKAITGVTSSTDKLINSNKKLSDSLGNQSNGLTALLQKGT